MRLKDKLILYCFHKGNQIEAESEQLRQTVRYRAMDSLDMYEVMLDKIRHAAWNEFLDDLFKIISNTK